MVTIGTSIVLADLMLAVWGGTTYQFEPPDWLGATSLPIVTGHRSSGTAVFLNTRSIVGAGQPSSSASRSAVQPHAAALMIRAGVETGRCRRPRASTWPIFVITFAIGAGSRLRRRGRRHRALDRPGEDVRYLLASLIVVIVGGMGWSAGLIGASLIGLAEQFKLAYMPTHGVVLTFLIMVAVLAFRPQGIMGGRHEHGGPALEARRLPSLPLKPWHLLSSCC